MPVYKYVCTEGHVFTVSKKMEEPHPESCLAESGCNAPARRTFSGSKPAEVLYRTGGFYSTDNAAGGGPATPSSTE